MPTGIDWLLLFPGALLGGLAGGVWILAGTGGLTRPFAHSPWIEFAMAMAVPIAAEILFRGMAHGIIAQSFRTQHTGGPWFLSWPVILSSLFYGLWFLFPLFPFFRQGPALTFAAALLFGISSGMVRERSESLLPCVILHWACVILLLVLPQYFPEHLEMLQRLLQQLG